MIDEEKSITCGTVSCLNVAVCVVHWPGKSVQMCKACADRADRVADAMGMARCARTDQRSTPKR